MSTFMGVGICWIGLNWADLDCWRLTLISVVINLVWLYILFLLGLLSSGEAPLILSGVKYPCITFLTVDKEPSRKECQQYYYT